MLVRFKCFCVTTDCYSCPFSRYVDCKVMEKTVSWKCVEIDFEASWSFGEEL